MSIKATNNFVFLQRDSIGKEKGGLLLPTSGQIKPHKGLILSIGGLVKDPNIKAAKGKSCLYHPTVGFSIEYDGIEYWVLSDNEIIAIV
jgi:co-chaperonin GroES (HSP10)